MPEVVAGEPGKLPLCFAPRVDGRLIDSMPLLPVLPTLSRLATGALNALTGREPWARERLSRHAGKTVRFVLASQSVSLTVCADGTVTAADAAIVPDVTLTLQSDKLRPERLLRGPSGFAEVTHISGDAALAQTVADLARDLRWDAEGDLARVVGDIPAMRLAAGARGALAGLRAAGGKLAANVSEYLTEERPVLAGRPLQAQWRQDLAALQAETDAVQHRMQALAARLARLGA